MSKAETVFSSHLTPAGRGYFEAAGLGVTIDAGSG
jgi:hypothetical protein